MELEPEAKAQLLLAPNLETCSGVSPLPSLHVGLPGVTPHAPDELV